MRTQVAKLSLMLQHRPASEAMLIRAVLLFTGLEVRTELLLDSAAARGKCRREGVRTMRQLSTKVFWLQQWLDEEEQRRAVAQTISDPGQGDGESPGSTRGAQWWLFL